MIPAIGSTIAGSSVGGASQVPASQGVTRSGEGSRVEFNEFTEVLSRFAVDAVDTVKTAEATSIQGVNGKASTQAVVEAVMSAERTLQTAVAIRDKAVAAYMELSRMQI